MNFGNFLIKRVVDDLARDLPKVKTFATLSPIPGFRPWLHELHNRDASDDFSEGERHQLEEATGEPDPNAALEQVLEQSDWFKADEICLLLEPLLLRLCARYLVQARDGARARDRVAHFHLTNGARIERINWLADTSPRGIAQSAGLMVNYRYKLEDIEKNHEAYASRGKVTTWLGVRKLL